MDSTWSLLGATWRLERRSKSHLDSIWRSKLASKRRLASILAVKLPSKRNFDSIWLFQLKFRSASDPQKPQFSFGKPCFLQGGLLCCRTALELLFCNLWNPTWSLVGASWSVLGGSWSVLGASWSQLGASWARSILGASWAPLGSVFCRSWALLGSLFAALGDLLTALGPLLDALGTLLAALGPLLAALGAILERHAKISEKSIPKMIDLVSKKGAQREPTSDPKRTKIEDKNRRETKTIFKTVSRLPWGDLGPFCGCPWAHLY